jgi:hypothetical protein
MTTVPEQGFTLLADDDVESGTRDELTVTMTVVGRDSAAIGRWLDVVGHAARLGGIECEIDAPDYHQVFYGWERRQRL